MCNPLPRLAVTIGDEAKDKLTQIDRFHVAQFAYVVERLKSFCDGDGTLLHRTTLVLDSGISDDDSHNYVDLQVLLAGGAMKRGHFHFAGKKPLADLWLTLGQRAEVKRDRFADSKGARTELA